MAARVIRQVPGWPTVVELDAGESFTLATAAGERTITLVSVAHDTEPDYWVTGNASREMIAGARVTVEVAGERAVVMARAYEMPMVVGGVRVYAETTKYWANTPQLIAVPGVEKEVRLSLAGEGESWGPGDVAFPVRDYRWRSGTYQNTWNSIVPFNNLYYHRGEDFGSIPDKREIISPWDGTVTTTPLPDGDGRSNGLTIARDDGMTVRLAHMNIETVSPQLVMGARVRRGDVLAKTGMTWDGRKSQTHDPHLHLGFHWDQTMVSPFPTMVEAYLRDYPDAVLAIAGGYVFGVPGKVVTLDGTRSRARGSEKIRSFRWTLPGGRIIEGALAKTMFDEPGYYAIELEVEAASGAVDRDFLQVRIYDPALGECKEIAYGWVHAYPTRGVRPGTEVLVWNRLTNVTGAMIDFGDGTAASRVEGEATHAYTAPGVYTLTVRGRGPRDEPAAARTRIVVDPA